jgi:hypothetical protein
MLVSGTQEVQLLCDNQKGFVERITAHFEQALTQLPPGVAERVGYPIFRDSKKTPPIQAADLLAYETFKEVRSRMESPLRPVSKALERLVQGRFHRADCIDWHLLDNYGERLKAGFPQKWLPPPPPLFNSERPIRNVGHWGI